MLPPYSHCIVLFTSNQTLTRLSNTLRNMLLPLLSHLSDICHRSMRGGAVRLQGPPQSTLSSNIRFFGARVIRPTSIVVRSRRTLASPPLSTLPSLLPPCVCVCIVLFASQHAVTRLHNILRNMLLLLLLSNLSNKSVLTCCRGA